VSPLEGYARAGWVCFERALVARDSFAGGERTFLTTEDAQAFRARIYQQHGAPRPLAHACPHACACLRSSMHARTKTLCFLATKGMPSSMIG
jgi:hypothetical protein